MASKVTVVGTGPGDPGFLTAAGKKEIENAEVLVGGKRLLETFAAPGQEKYIVDRDLLGVVDFIKENYRRKKLVVLVSGDTGIYSLASYLSGKLPPEILEFIPGISSVQLMFARLKKPWQDASILSLHGRPPGGITEKLNAGETIALLTGGEYTPRRVAEYLLGEGCGDRPVAVGINLSYPGESLQFTRLAELAASPGVNSPAVVVINYE